MVKIRPLDEYCCQCKAYIPHATAFQLTVPGQMMQGSSYLCSYCIATVAEDANRIRDQFKQEHPELATAYETELFLKNL